MAVSEIDAAQKMQGGLPSNSLARYLRVGQLQTNLLAKVEQCRRLAREITDPLTSNRLLELADEYIWQIKNGSAGHRD
ncbi:hypothetical protein OZ411_06050 [Bradyrhizobium sp. Arg237L]|uniref:hypothetical protein n=1 Tax=Bradyrhizobium sp. Arg237L TaxID=3003352 RepID=UPI00249F093C|nr:hypothetical protein [Bradyrhizobium sp. Arg237L]MDI4232378.1 hypothetical protein [Bradyrhizobium sp. Arg237L]